MIHAGILLRKNGIGAQKTGKSDKHGRRRKQENEEGKENMLSICMLANRKDRKMERKEKDV